MPVVLFHSGKRRAFGTRVIGSILLVLAGLAATAEAQQIVWGPTESAETQGYYEGYLSYFDANDFWGAEFTLQTDALEVSAKLWRGENFDLATTTLRAQVRALDPPYNVVAGWDVPLDLTGLTGAGPGGGQWRTVVLQPGGTPLNGTYWVGIKGGPNIPERALLNYAEMDATSTWDPVAQRYIEWDGLIYRADSGSWMDNKADAYIRIRQKEGFNVCPTAEIDSIDPNPAVEERDVTFTGLGHDAGAIHAYEWTLGDGSLLSQARTFNLSFHRGTYPIRFRVKDNDECWSDYDTEQLEVEPGDPPTISGLRDAGGLDQLGTFISGLPITVTNTYSVRVDPGEFQATRVRFTISKPGYDPVVQDITSAQGNRWYATFTVSDLEAGTYTLSATAYDALGNASDPVSKTFRMVDPPPWWTDNDPNNTWVGDQTVSWDSDARRYTFTGWIPHNPAMFLRIQPDIEFPYLGTLENSAGLRIDVTEEFFARDAWTNSASGGLSATLLGQKVVDEPFDIAYVAGSTYDAGQYTWSWNSGTLLEYSTNLYDGTLFTGWAGPIYYEVHLSVDFGMEADVTVGGTLDSALTTDDLCITPGLTAAVSFDASVDILFGVATFGVVGTPTVGFDLPICYNLESGPHFPGPCVTFVLVVEAYVKVLWGAGEWSSGDYELGETSWGEGCGPGLDGLLTGGQRPIPPFQSPRIASDANGNALCVWIHDDNGGVSPADPDVYYSYYDALTGQWTAPGPVEVGGTDLYETDPRVVFTGIGQALLVVTQDQLTYDECLAAQPIEEWDVHEVTLAEQELVSYTYNGAQDRWTWVGRVHTDPSGIDNGARADGRCELAAGPNGTATVVWVRDPDGFMPDDEDEHCDTDIWVSQWVAGAWTPAQALAQGAAGYVEPNVAYDLAGNGNAVAVWVADADSDLYTNGDRTIEYAYYSSAQQKWLNAPKPAVAGLPGVLWPTVCFDMFGQPVIVFTQRGPDDGILPSGADYSEGVHDYLFSASSTPPGGGFPFLFDRIEPVGGPCQNRARWPRATVANTPQGPMAFVGCRSFKGVGADGYDGELAFTMKNLEATRERTGGQAASGTRAAFPSPVLLTNDRELDWQVDLDADNSIGILRAVWVRPVDNDPQAGFGDGFDSIRLLEIPLGPDLRITANHIAVSSPYPQPGQTVTIWARVRNSGTQNIVGATVGFYLDDFPAGEIGSVNIPLSGYQGLHPVGIPWTADGLSHDLIVVVDPNNVIGELNEENNTAGIPIVAVDPPAGLSVSPQIPTQSLAVSWTPPNVLDPASPHISAYRVYRDTGSGFALLTETLGTTWVDSTASSASYQVTAVSDAGAESLPAGPVSGSVPAILDNHVIRARFTDYGTSGDRFPHATATPADIAWLPVSSGTQVYSWEGNLRYDDGGGEANHLLADPDEFTVVEPLHVARGAVASQTQNDEFAIVATHSLDGATLTTQLQITNTSGDELTDVSFAWMLDADLVLPGTDPRQPCCPYLPWLGFGSGRWFAGRGQGVQTNVNHCAGVVPAEISVTHAARLDGSEYPNRWTVSNPVGFQGATCAFDGPVQAEPRYVFELPFDNTAGCVGFDQDLAIVTSLETANWPDGVVHTFTYTLTFHRPGDADADGVIGRADFAALETCLEGPGGGPISAECETFDFDCDDDVDLVDFSVLQAVFTGD